MPSVDDSSAHQSGSAVTPGEFVNPSVFNPGANPPVSLNYDQNLASVTSPLGDNLTQATRDKIGRGEFIELGTLKTGTHFQLKLLKGLHFLLILPARTA